MNVVSLAEVDLQQSLGRVLHWQFLVQSILWVSYRMTFGHRYHPVLMSSKNLDTLG